MAKAMRPSERAALARQRPVINTYHVHNAELTDLGGTRVRDVDGKRVVQMTEVQAQYWIDQGVISDLPLNEQPEEAQAALRQFGKLSA